MAFRKSAAAWRTRALRDAYEPQRSSLPSSCRSCCPRACDRRAIIQAPSLTFSLLSVRPFSEVLPPSVPPASFGFSEDLDFSLPFPLLSEAHPELLVLQNSVRQELNLRPASVRHSLVSPASVHRRGPLAFLSTPICRQSAEQSLPEHSDNPGSQLLIA